MDLWGSDDETPKPRGRPTWLSSYYPPYIDAYGEKPSDVAVRRLARVLKPLEMEYAREEVVKRFGHYCAATPIRFYSAERFAETFAAWKEPQVAQSKRYDPLEPLPGESGDAYLARITR